MTSQSRSTILTVAKIFSPFMLRSKTQDSSFENAKAVPYLKLLK